MMTRLDRRSVLQLSVLALLSVPASADTAAEDDPWPGLAADIFAGRPLQPTDTIVSLDAPYRAEDAAVTPLTLRLGLPAGDGRAIKTVTLVIDHNPVPVAAVFTIGSEASISTIATRVRVNENSNIHAVAELSDGSLHVTAKFVKAAGGCSAPSMKNQDEAMANLGKMKLRQFPVPSGAANMARDVQLMIRHPNNSGFQIDQVTHYYIPARYVSDIEISRGKSLLLKIEGGISLSEDPNIRFTYRGDDEAEYNVKAIDTQEASFTASWPAIAPGAPGT